MRSRIIAVDFDGCIVAHRFPEIGHVLPHAEHVLRELSDAGHRLILHTCRTNQDLLAAISLVMRLPGIDWHGFNANRIGDEYPGVHKLYADLYIDDKGLGAPLCDDGEGVPGVDWLEVKALLLRRGYLVPSEGVV